MRKIPFILATLLLSCTIARQTKDYKMEVRVYKIDSTTVPGKYRVLMRKSYNHYEMLLDSLPADIQIGKIVPLTLIRKK